MLRARIASTLLTQVELALLAGRNLEQVETEILADAEVREELAAGDREVAVGLWARGAWVPPRRRLKRR